jgi:hypothetical protein
MSKVRFWDYKGDDLWLCRETGVPIKTPDIDWPLDGGPKPGRFLRGDILIQIEEKGQMTIGGLRQQDLVAYIRYNTVPQHTDGWFYDGKKLARYLLYSKSAAACPEQHEKEYQARKASVETMVPLGDRQLFFLNMNATSQQDTGFLLMCHFLSNSWTNNEEHYTSAEFTVDWAKISSDSQSNRLYPYAKDELRVLKAIKEVARKEKPVLELQAALKTGDLDKAVDRVDLIDKAINVLLPGMQYSPTTGMDAPLSALSQVDAGFKAVQALQDPTLTADTAPGLGTVLDSQRVANVGGLDSALCVLGSLLQLRQDLKLYRMMKKDAADTKQYPKGWDDPAFKAKYGKCPQATALLNNVGSAMSVGMAIVNTLSTLKSAKFLDQAPVLFRLADNIPGWVLPAATAVLGTGYAVRLGKQAHKSGKQWKALARLKRQMEACQDKRLKPDTLALLAFAVEGTHRKHWTKGLASGASAVTAASSAALTAAALIAGANIWNPIGWGLGIAAFVMGGVLQGYRLYRRNNQAEFDKKRTFKKDQFPTKLIAQFLLEANANPGSLDVYVLYTILAEFGLSLPTVLFHRVEAETAVLRQVTWT